jgi:hypothetical protein
MKNIHWILAAALMMSVGCGTKQEYATCEAPNDHLEVMFKPESSISIFSHPFCIVCNPGLEPGEYGDWAVEMGAPEAPTNTDGLLPCLYVYSEVPHTDGPDTLEKCESLVCDGTARYNDMVRESNKNFNLSPILD